jgi:hypothetical protein
MIARLKHSGGSRLAAVLGTVSHRLQSSTRWTSMATSLQGVYDSLRPDRRRAIPADGSGRATASGRHANCPPGDRGNAPADRHPPLDVGGEFIAAAVARLPMCRVRRGPIQWV